MKLLKTFLAVYFGRNSHASFLNEWTHFDFSYVFSMDAMQIFILIRNYSVYVMDEFEFNTDINRRTFLSSFKTF